MTIQGRVQPVSAQPKYGIFPCPDQVWSISSPPKALCASFSQHFPRVPPALTPHHRLVLPICELRMEGIPQCVLLRSVPFTPHQLVRLVHAASSGVLFSHVAANTVCGRCTLHLIYPFCNWRTFGISGLVLLFRTILVLHILWWKHRFIFLGQIGWVMDRWAFSLRRQSHAVFQKYK